MIVLTWKGNYTAERQVKEEADRVAESPGFRERVELTRGLWKSLYVPEERINSFLESLKSLPKRFMYDMMIRCIMPEFAAKYGFTYDEIDPRQIMLEVCDLEYGRVAEPQTPVQKEYLAMWTQRTAAELSSITQGYRQLPPEAYEPPAKKQEPQKQEGKPLQNLMDELFGGFKS